MSGVDVEALRALSARVRGWIPNGDGYDSQYAHDMAAAADAIDACDALRSGLVSNGCEVVDDAEDEATGEGSGPWIRNTRAEAAEAALLARSAAYDELRARVDAAEKKLRGLLSALPTTLECHVFHHTKKDRHEIGDRCPCEDRYTAAIVSATEDSK